VADPSLPERLREHLRATSLFPETGLALLAVSGGADSLALLDLLASLAPELGLSLLVAHADHGILPQSAEIAERVRRVARERYGLETVAGALALGPGTGETRARIARYRFLRRVQAERGARYVATAHHADDQVETVLLRLLRGSAPAGLAGIPARGPRGLVRPLLPFRRAELAAHVAALGMPAFEDPANADLRHTRSWVRRRLLPAIEERLGAEAARALLSVARHAAEDVRAWDALLDALPGLDFAVESGRVEVARGVLSGYDNVLTGRILRAACRRAELHLPPGAALRLARFAARAASGRRLPLGDDLVAETAFDRLVITREAVAPPSCALAGETGEVTFGRHVVRWRTEPAPARITREGWTSWFPGGALVLRVPESGERLVPLGGAGRRKVARLLMEAQVPRGDRARWPVVVQGGVPLWIPGVCRGAAAVPGPGTQSVRVDVGDG
jgi:tRNA(Ile)-lysidine synthase